MTTNPQRLQKLKQDAPLQKMRKGLVYVRYNGEIAGKTKKAYGIAPINERKIRFWVPKKLLGAIYYLQGTSRKRLLREEFYAIELPGWIAQKNGLTGLADNQDLG